MAIRPSVYVIGHGVAPLASMVRRLKQYGVDYVVDARDRPFSNLNAEMERKNLHHILKRNRIRYRFCGDSFNREVPGMRSEVNTVGGVPVEDYVNHNVAVLVECDDVAACQKRRILWDMFALNGFASLDITDDSMVVRGSEKDGQHDKAERSKKTKT